MANTSKLTIEQVKQKKMDLELAILGLLKEFEESSGLNARHIRMARKKVERGKNEDYDAYDRKMMQQPIENVIVECELDLMY